MTGVLALLRAVSPRGLALRLVVWLAPVVALLLTGVGGPGPRVLLLAVVLVLAAVAAVNPESPLLTVALGLVVAWWALAARDTVPVAALPAGVLLLAAHLASTVLGHGPRQLVVDTGLLLRWSMRAVLLGSAIPVVWLVAAAAHGRTPPSGEWAAGLAAATLVCVLGAISVRSAR